MMLSRSLKLMGYVHATLFFALMIPLVCTFAELEEPAGAGVLYLKCLLAAVPVIVTDRAAKRVKSLAAYIIICVLLIAGIWGIAGLSNASGAYDACYYIGMSVETFVIALKRMQRRLKESALRREREPFAAREAEFLDTPSLPLVWYFAAVYVCGLCLNAKPLCDMAFYSAVVYLFLALAATYLRATQSYLEINKRTKGIPKRRLYGVSFSMLLIFSALLFIGILPSVFMAGQRQYTDIRQWFDGVELVPYEYWSDNEFHGASAADMGMMQLMYESGPPPEPSAVMNGLFWVIGGVCMLVLLYGIILVIRQVFQDFRNSRDENGDIIEEIKETEKSGREDMLGKGRRGMDNAAEKIKRRYRKMIRKHRKDRPAPHESPAEIEEYAGLKDDEQMQLLHEAYEEVRYGK